MMRGHKKRIIVQLLLIFRYLDTMNSILHDGNGDDGERKS
jgi:hypothetical protein